jgi:hypothetical protein
LYINRRRSGHPALRLAATLQVALRGPAVIGGDLSFGGRGQ